MTLRAAHPRAPAGDDPPPPARRRGGRVRRRRASTGRRSTRSPQAAGFTKGAVYSNFTSKDDLFLALLDDRIDRQFAIVTEVLGQRAARPGRAAPPHARRSSSPARSSADDDLGDALPRVRALLAPQPGGGGEARDARRARARVRAAADRGRVRGVRRDAEVPDPTSSPQISLALFGGLGNLPARSTRRSVTGDDARHRARLALRRDGRSRRRRSERRSVRRGARRGARRPSADAAGRRGARRAAGGSRRTAGRVATAPWRCGRRTCRAARGSRPRRRPTSQSKCSHDDVVEQAARARARRGRRASSPGCGQTCIRAAALRRSPRRPVGSRGRTGRRRPGRRGSRPSRRGDRRAAAGSHALRSRIAGSIQCQAVAANTRSNGAPAGGSHVSKSARTTSTSGKPARLRRAAVDEVRAELEAGRSGTPRGERACRLAGRAADLEQVSPGRSPVSVG